MFSRKGVVANNVANINTTGFKRSRAEFTDLIYQTERLMGVSNRGRDATVPEGAQIGLGVRTAAIRSLGDAIDLVQSAIWMVVVGAGPCVGAAMAVGVVIALLQALTQIQEMTLTFVPKMIAVFVAASLTASFVGAKFSIFTQSIYARIEQGYR